MAEFGKWTSVEEELPKETKSYLIFGTFTCVPDHVDGFLIRQVLKKQITGWNFLILQRRR